MLAVLVKHGTIKVDAAQRIHVVSAVQADPRFLSMCIHEIDAKLCLVDLYARYDPRVIHQVIKRHRLGLLVQRRDVGIARHLQRIAKSPVHQFVDAQDCLAETTMTDQHVEALHLPVNVCLQWARAIARLNR